MSKTAIRPCSCQSSYQDDRYGKGMRVHNERPSKVKGGERYGCTVCGTGAKKKAQPDAAAFRAVGGRP